LRPPWGFPPTAAAELPNARTEEGSRSSWTAMDPKREENRFSTVEARNRGGRKMGSVRIDLMLFFLRSSGFPIGAPVFLIDEVYQHVFFFYVPS
jgi:hypothetical protein